MVMNSLWATMHMRDYPTLARATIEEYSLKGKWSDSEKLPPEKSQMRGRYRNTWYWCMDEIIGEYHAAYRLYEKGKWKC